MTDKPTPLSATRHFHATLPNIHSAGKLDSLLEETLQSLGIQCYALMTFHSNWAPPRDELLGKTGWQELAQHIWEQGAQKLGFDDYLSHKASPIRWRDVMQATSAKSCFPRHPFTQPGLDGWLYPLYVSEQELALAVFLGPADNRLFSEETKGLLHSVALMAHNTARKFAFRKKQTHLH